MAKYIKADFLIKEINNRNKENWHGITWSSRMVASLLREAPKVDAIDVIRCKDCKHAEQRSKGLNCYYWYAHVEPDNYCSWGTKREDH